MRRAVLLLVTMAVAVLSCSVVTSGPPTAPPVATVVTGGPPTAPEAPPKPNIVFILADDMRKDDLKYMPKTRSLLGQQGMSFAKAFVSNAVCCPSRATIMRGQYSHNNGVWTNSGKSKDGGWGGYKANGNEQDNVATRLDNAGYRTALIGKYLNAYRSTAVPPGWDYWFGKFDVNYFDYDVNDNGTIRHFGTRKRDYATYVISRQAQRFIDTSAAQGKPFFAYVAPTAPHGPFLVAPRHRRAFDGLRAPHPPSFNESDVSDKPPWIRNQPTFTYADKADIDFRYERRAELMQSLDDLVEGVVGKLRATGELKNTYILFTSDNGYHHGEHRIPEGKWRPYEEDIRVPLLVRGPGVAAGSTTDRLALNTDFLPTFTNLAGVQTPGYADGRSLRPVIKGNSTTWRSAVLLEASRHGSPAYYGIRTSSGSKYVEYEGGLRELYQLGADPYELSNKYDAAAPPAALASRLQALKECAGESCRTAEGP